MSQNQNPKEGDKMFNRSAYGRSEAERSQLQYFDRQRQDVQPQHTPMQPRANPVAGQYVGGYTGMNPVPNSSTSQFGVMPNMYSPTPSMPASQQAMPTLMRPMPNTMTPPTMYPGHGSYSSNVAYGGPSAQTHSAYRYGQPQSNSQIIPTSHPSQWSPNQNDPNDLRAFAGHNHRALNWAQSQQATHSLLHSTSAPAILHPTQSTQRTTQSLSSPRPRGSSTSSRGRSPASRSGSRSKSKRKSRGEALSPSDHGVSKHAAQEPFKWRSGMKDRKITSDMTEEEKHEAELYNSRLAAAKKAHTREQNRVSAQKSRAKKVELLVKTESQVKDLQEENDRLQKRNASLSAQVQRLTNDNLQLRTQNEILQYRIRGLEQQQPMQGQRPIVNQYATLPSFASQSQNPSPGLHQGPGANRNPLEGLDVVDYSLTSLTAAENDQLDVKLPPLDPTLLLPQPQQPQLPQLPQQPQEPQQSQPAQHAQQPTTGDNQDLTTQAEQPNLLIDNVQGQDAPLDWLGDLEGFSPDFGADNPSWDPSAGGAQ
ncbi:hypothetical protein F5Y13DRAFT_204090 [Hypoxylon sp. FL1857]|nr:hypothetical protein F5Y13DRAFT_204090 [Hypoxylon sp. FL1857]